MADLRDAKGKLEDAETQIARLREQVEMLMRDRITPAVADFAGRAESAMADAASTVRQQAHVVTDQVREKPLAAVLIAAAFGWIIGRTMR